MLHAVCERSTNRADRVSVRAVRGTADTYSYVTGGQMTGAWVRRACVAGAITTLAAITAVPVGAVQVTTTCTVFAVNADGSKGGALPVDPLPLPFTVPSLDSGVTELPANFSFNLPTQSTTIPLPAVA